MSKRSFPNKIEIIGQEQPANIASEFHILHTPNEFIVTMLEVIPQMEFISRSGVTSSGEKLTVPQLKTSKIIQRVVGRFGLSPAAFKKMVRLLNKNLNQYESKFGEIAINPPEGLQ